MTPLRILIVEDEWSIAYDHSRVLQKAGHQVIGPVPDVPQTEQDVVEEGAESSSRPTNSGKNESHKMPDMKKLGKFFKNLGGKK